jgi:hypothetical protein
MSGQFDDPPPRTSIDWTQGSNYQNIVRVLKGDPVDNKSNITALNELFNQKWTQCFIGGKTKELVFGKWNIPTYKGLRIGADLTFLNVFGVGVDTTNVNWYIEKYEKVCERHGLMVVCLYIRNFWVDAYTWMPNLMTPGEQQAANEELSNITKTSLQGGSMKPVHARWVLTKRKVTSNDGTVRALYKNNSTGEMCVKRMVRSKAGKLSASYVNARG